MTWVLIIVMLPMYKATAAVSIPGYATVEQCRIAAQESIKYPPVSSAFCIPGPITKNQTP